MDEQLEYEWQFFLSKIKVIDEDRYNKLISLKFIEPYSLFLITKGGVRYWEKLK